VKSSQIKQEEERKRKEIVIVRYRSIILILQIIFACWLAPCICETKQSSGL